MKYKSTRAPRKLLADAIVSQLADAYGDLYAEQQRIREEMDAIKEKVIDLGGNVSGERYHMRVMRSFTTSHHGMLAWLRKNHSAIVSRFESVRVYHSVKIAELP